MATDKVMSFSPMTSILKKPSLIENDCRKWIATEKVHGASFQFYTSDGDIIHLGSRTRCLDGNASFQKCDLNEFRDRHSNHVKRLYNEVKTAESWQHYITIAEKCNVESDDDEDCEVMAATRKRDFEMLDVGENGEGEEKEQKKDIEKSAQLKTEVEVRIYGELYGGGGVDKDIKPAIQKEIIYCDEFRFYVFGITINKRWVNILEMNDLCTSAGFPYFATPVCAPMNTLNELQDFLITGGFMNSKSRLTERKDDFKTKIEGVVMSPLERPGYKRHAIKLLSAAFTDVRQTRKGKNVQVNYCTKARYLSVISKLDIPEREDTEMVTRMFIEDIVKESGEPLSTNKCKGCVKAVRGWLAKDGYLEDAQLHNNSPKTKDLSERKTRTKIAENSLSVYNEKSEMASAEFKEGQESVELDMSFADLFGDV